MRNVNEQALMKIPPSFDKAEIHGRATKVFDKNAAKKLMENQRD